MPTASLTGRLPNQWAGRASRLGPIASRAVDSWDARNPRTTTQQKTKSKRLPGPGGSNEPTVAPPPLRKQLETNYYHKNNAHPNLQKTTADSKNTPEPQPQIRAWPNGVLLVISTLLGATAAAGTALAALLLALLGRTSRHHQTQHMARKPTTACKRSTRPDANTCTNTKKQEKNDLANPTAPRTTTAGSALGAALLGGTAAARRATALGSHDLTSKLQIPVRERPPHNTNRNKTRATPRTARSPKSRQPKLQNTTNQPATGNRAQPPCRGISACDVFRPAFTSRPASSNHATQPKKPNPPYLPKAFLRAASFAARFRTDTNAGPAPPAIPSCDPTPKQRHATHIPAYGVRLRHASPSMPPQSKPTCPRHSCVRWAFTPRAPTNTNANTVPTAPTHATQPEQPAPTPPRASALLRVTRFLTRPTHTPNPTTAAPANELGLRVSAYGVAHHAFPSRGKRHINHQHHHATQPQQTKASRPALHTPARNELSSHAPPPIRPQPNRPALGIPACGVPSHHESPPVPIPCQPHLPT